MVAYTKIHTYKPILLHTLFMSTSKIKKRGYLSWSSISSFEWDKRKWYKKYILGEKEEFTPELLFGKQLADSLQTPNPLAAVTLYTVVEQPVDTKLGQIALKGFIDTYDPITHNFREFKTGKKLWDQKRADNHGQLKMYALMLYLIHKVKPEEYTIHLDWIPTRNTDDDSIDFVYPMEIKTFQVHLTLLDILKFAVYIKKIAHEMKIYIDKYHMI